MDRLLFWTDWGQQPRVESACMDATCRHVIANTSLFWPNGLTLDYATDRVYWVDAKHRVIESASLDGSDRRLVLDAGACSNVRHWTARTGGSY